MEREVAASGSRARMCPSGQPHMSGASAFAVIQGTATKPSATYFDRLVPLTPEILALSSPAEPTEVFRIGAACAGNCCRHFSEGRCQLVTRLVAILPTAESSPPPCALRNGCMWWHQEGVAACLRCPQIVTRMYGASESLKEAASPR